MIVVDEDEEDEVKKRASRDRASSVTNYQTVIYGGKKAQVVTIRNEMVTVMFDDDTMAEVKEADLKPTKADPTQV